MKKVGKLFLGLIIGATMLLSSCSSGGSNSIPLLPSGGNRSPLKKSLSLLFYPYLVLLYSKTIEKEH